jgi:hypothetical protein
MLQSTFSYSYLPLQDEISWQKLAPERVRLCLDEPLIKKLDLTFAWHPSWEVREPMLDGKVAQEQFARFSDSLQEMVVKVCSDGRPIVERGIELAPHLRTGRNRIPQEEMVGHLGCALRVASRNLTIQHRLFWTYRDVSPVAVPPFRWDGGSYRLVLWSYLK